MTYSLTNNQERAVWAMVRDIAVEFYDWGKNDKHSLATGAMNAVGDRLRRATDAQYTAVTSILADHYRCAPLDVIPLHGGCKDKRSLALAKRAEAEIKAIDNPPALAVAAE